MSHPSHHGASGYEKQDTNAFRIGLILVISTVILVVVLIFTANLFSTMKENAFTEAVLKPESTALRELKAREVDVLGSYGIVDATKGIYRIPIERAMQFVADEAYSSTKSTNTK